MAIRFEDAPFKTDLPELLDLEKGLKRKISTESYSTWTRKGKEVLNLRQTVTQSFTEGTHQTIGGVVDQKTFGVFIDKHLGSKMGELIKKVGDKLAYDSWFCISLHQRPDGNIKMEWLYDKQFLLTVNILAD